MPEYTPTIEVLRFNKIVQATTGTNATVVVCSHSQQPLDFFVNVTRNTMPPIRYNGTNARRKIETTTSVSFAHTSSISGQTNGDWIALYKFEDVTQYVCQNSIQIQLEVTGDDSASFDAIQTFTPPGYFLTFDGYHGSALTIVNKTVQWDVNSKSWVEKTASGVDRYRHRCESIGNLAYILSGRSPAVGDVTSVKSYSQASDSYVSKGEMNFSRDDAESCSYDNKIWIYSGYSSSFGDFLVGSEMYDPLTDVWSVDSSYDHAFRGDGINICKNLFFVMYALDKGTPTNVFKNYDVFEDLITSTFTTYFVAHTDPDRCNSKAGFKIDEYKCLSVGGSSTIDGFGTLNNVTRVNWLGKVYSQSANFPTNIQEGYCDQYGQYSIYACGVDWDSATYAFNAARIYNYPSDTWSALTNAPYDIHWGCATVV